jgi:AraC family transcriptional regulator of adaptative response/methylated-DNA-[protein]-cysteine methyltransferase
MKTKIINTPGQNVINIIRLNTPLGLMYGGATADGVCLLEFTDRKMLETEFKDLTRLLNAVILPGSNHHLVQLELQLSEYFAGQRTTFNLKLNAPGTQFQQAVWQELQEIAYGTTISYKEQATRLNNPNAVRAVAGANGHNRISIIIPCHRVIGSNGTLTGYGGGIQRKQWLLDFEAANLEASKSQGLSK